MTADPLTLTLPSEPAVILWDGRKASIISDRTVSFEAMSNLTRAVMVARLRAIANELDMAT